MGAIHTSAGDLLLHFGCSAEGIGAQGVTECMLSFIR